MNMAMGETFTYDGMLHWCFLISVAGFAVAMMWTLIRVLLPLRRLVREATQIMQGSLPAFDTPVGGIREVDKLRQSLRCMITQIQSARELESAYRKALTESQENERMRIARDIHDDTIQSLVLVSHSIDRAMQSQQQDDHVALVTHLEDARRQLLRGVDDLRQVIANLRPTILDELGLATALEVLCENRPALEFSLVGDAFGIDHARELALFRVAQETTRNAERYAQASKIQVNLCYSEAAVALEVRDDGVGFDVPRPLQTLAASGHYGLLGVQERVLHLGGQMNLNSRPAAGTCITVTIPVRAALAAS